MHSFKWWMLAATVASGLSQVAPQLTTIQDTLYNADGTRFSGVAAISWQSFDSADSSDIASHVLRIPITNGYLQVQLVPTANSNPQVLYSVTYTGEAGIQFSESWNVPASLTPLRVRDVRVSSGAGTVTAPPSETVRIADVLGLAAALALRPVAGTGYASSRAAVIDALGGLDGAIGNLTDCVHVDGTSGSCGSAGTPVIFVDSESPGGTINGTNASFSLSNAPTPASSLALFRNGMLLQPGVDFTLTGSSIQFMAGKLPSLGDILQGSYRVAATLPGVGFVDSEVPSGAVDGTNLVFSITKTASPLASVALYRNGLRLRASVDYSISGTTITFLTGLAPQPSDLLLCSYRIAQ
jgi:hypothetical protein